MATTIRTTASDEGFTLHELGDGTESKVDAFVHSAACPDRISGPYVYISDATDRVVAKAAAARDAALMTNTAALDARDALALLEQRSTDPREGVTADQLAAARRAKAKARERADEASAESTRAKTDSSGMQQLLAALGEQIKALGPQPITSGAGLLADGRTRWTSNPIKLAPEPKLPATEKLAGFIGEKRAERTRLLAQHAETIAAPVPAEFAKAEIVARIDGLAASGRIGVRLPSKDASAGLIWPMRSLEAAPPLSNPSAVPRAIDTEAVLCNFFRDQVVEEAERAVDAAYEGVEITLEPHEKRRELQRLDAAILESERAEVAAILRLIDSGTNIAFRPDTSAKAILGLA